MTGKVIPFNPLDKQNLGASVAEALLSKDAHPLEELTSFREQGFTRFITLAIILLTGNWQN